MNRHVFAYIYVHERSLANKHKMCVYAYPITHPLYFCRSWTLIVILLKTFLVTTAMFKFVVSMNFYPWIQWHFNPLGSRRKKHCICIYMLTPKVYVAGVYYFCTACHNRLLSCTCLQVLFISCLAT